DLDCEPLTYAFDWGDGTIDVSQAVPSGQTAQMSHAWSVDACREVRVTAMDPRGGVSPPSDPYRVEVLDLACRGGNVDADAPGEAITNVLSAIDSAGQPSFGRGRPHVVRVHRSQSIEVSLAPAPHGPFGPAARFLVLGWVGAPTPESDTDLDRGVGKM